MSERLNDLRKLRLDLIDRMETCRSDQNYAIMGRLLADVVREVDELERGKADAGKVTGLSEFERKLNARVTSAPLSRRA